jgi:hypothetical protein
MKEEVIRVSWPTPKQLALLKKLEGNAKPPPRDYSEAAWRIERIIGR